MTSANTTPDYAELHCLSNFSFGRGASSPRELFERARKLGYTALAITDEASMVGIVRAFEAAREFGMHLIVGSELRIEDGPRVVLLAENRDGYAQLCRLITRARRRSEKGQYRLLRDDFDKVGNGLLVLWLPGDPVQQEHGAWLSKHFPGRTWLAVELHHGPDDAARLRTCLEAADTLDLPSVAAGDVHMHQRRRRALQDMLTANRLGLQLGQAAAHLFPNGERHLRPRAVLAEVYPAALLAETGRIAARCQFALTDLRYRYPHETVPPGYTPDKWLRQLSEQGMRWRWPGSISDTVRQQIDNELALISELGYASYFLTVYDIVRFARERGILCQGRGSAANSAVCFVLGITEVDPMRMNMLFERFISRERDEPPDIDVDFDSARREEVIQYVYRHYGRRRAALTAVVTSYRARSAVRDVARALGFSSDQTDRLARCIGAWSDTAPDDDALREAGFDPASPTLHRLRVLVGELIGFPRHLSQHPGGFFIAEDPLDQLVPVENAAMPERTVIQWDKDDLDTLGLLKVDVLGIGMLGAMARCFDLLRASGRRDLSPATVPAEDPATYAMIRRAGTVGVFQIESRAQMSMLPRLQPRCFYDLVIEVAIVRPGPIQGQMVHPYLNRRRGREPVSYPSAALEKVLSRTLGVPLFQEQVMQIAMIAAGYSAGEADELRRSMAAWKRRGGMEHHRRKILAGMARRGYSREFAKGVFEQIRGFGSYGFPESHAASYALLAYVSSWLKCHEPAALLCGLLDTQPMGFYAPAQLVQDIRRQGVEVRPVDVRHSHWLCTLEADRAPVDDIDHQPAVRLGLGQVRGLHESVGQRLVQARAAACFTSIQDLVDRAGLQSGDLDCLAEAGALEGLAGHRHQARWAATGTRRQLPLFAGSDSPDAGSVTLAAPAVGEDIVADYASTGLTLGAHPVSLLRRNLDRRGCRRSSETLTLRSGSRVRTAGLVTQRQRPQTASGVVFVTLEDEDGPINIIVWRDLAERQQRQLIESRLLAVDGKLEAADGVRHVIASHLEDLSALLGRLRTRSRDFH
ncbi:MAG: error-prone DNA polymerase [Rhodanobacteraceae bacterium]